MDNFFDNLCRTLATPMPRARALKIIAGGLAGSLLAPFAFGQGQGNKPVDPKTPGGGGGKQKCTGGCVCSGASGGCCSTGQTCWGGLICCAAGYLGAQAVKGNKVACVQKDASGNFPANYTQLNPLSTC